jgi:hypothetical protein
MTTKVKTDLLDVSAAVKTLLDQTTTSGAITAIAVKDVTQSGYLDLSEISAPSSPAANVARVYSKDNGGGATKLYFKDNAGTETEIGGGAAGWVGSTAGQIPFPAVQAPSADANTLDDYEEGTWTPTISFATIGNLAVTYSSQLGTYTKIGRTVFCVFQVIASAFTHTTASGSLQIGGLPFTVGANARGGILWEGITKANYTDAVALPVAAGTIANVQMAGSGQARASVAVGDMPSGGTPFFGGSFFYNV